MFAKSILFYFFPSHRQCCLLALLAHVSYLCAISAQLSLKEKRVRFTRLFQEVQKKVCLFLCYCRGHTADERKFTLLDPKAEETAKKHVGKIREEEANKEKHPSPVSPAAQEKLTEMEKKAQEHDKNKK